MRYAISYVSTAEPNLSPEQLNFLLEDAAKNNNSQNISGLLLCSGGNFFQLIEGEEKTVKELFSRIEKDPRHKNLIKFLEIPVHRQSYDGYISRLVSEQSLYNDEKLKNYMNYIEVLDPKSKKAVKRVLEAMII